MKDTVENEFIGTFTDWRLRLWGESIDASKAKPFPMPLDEDDEDDEETQTAHVFTTSVSVLPTTSLEPHPTDHPERPTAIKPVNDAEITTSAASVVATTSSTTSSTTSATSSAATSTATNAYSLPSIFPTFGVSPRTQIWIYGAITAIIIFCIALGAFFCVWRRRRGRTDHMEYEFEMVNDSEADGADQPLSGDKRRKRRGGELYDAFAGGSDEELFSDDEEEQYKDEKPSTGARRGDGSPDGYSEKNAQGRVTR